MALPRSGSSIATWHVRPPKVYRPSATRFGNGASTWPRPSGARSDSVVAVEHRTPVEGALPQAGTDLRDDRLVVARHDAVLPPGRWGAAHAVSSCARSDLVSRPPANVADDTMAVMELGFTAGIAAIVLLGVLGQLLGHAREGPVDHRAAGARAAGRTGPRAGWTRTRCWATPCSRWCRWPWGSCCSRSRSSSTSPGCTAEPGGRCWGWSRRARSSPASAPPCSPSWVFDLPFSRAAVIGAILIVSGPTVVGPLLAVIRPKQPLESVLAFEGIFIDPIGATVALSMVHLALHKSGTGSAPRRSWASSPGCGRRRGVPGGRPVRARPGGHPRRARGRRRARRVRGRGVRR